MARCKSKTLEGIMYILLKVTTKGLCIKHVRIWVDTSNKWKDIEVGSKYDFEATEQPVSGPPSTPLFFLLSYPIRDTITFSCKELKDNLGKMVEFLHGILGKT